MQQSLKAEHLFVCLHVLKLVCLRYSSVLTLPQRQ